MSGIIDGAVIVKLVDRGNMGIIGNLVDFPARQCRLIGMVWESVFSR
jgi:hypothetical protein